MSDLAVITPTFRGDAEIFGDLHRSVLRFTPESTVHHVVVAPRDRRLFARYAGPRCRLWTTADLLPARYLHTRMGRLETFVNLRRPWPPVRGWISQQAIKIAMTARLDAPVALLADSDVVLVRPVHAERFVKEGGVILYRDTDGVTADMDRHILWHRVSREVLGLPDAPHPPLPDYVSPFSVWDPAVIRRMQSRIAEVAGRDWLDVFCGQLHISEFILYGVFADSRLPGAPPAPPPADTTICHNYWDRTPLSRAGAVAFADRLKPEAVAMMISAKSGTPADVRRVAIDRCAEITDAG